MSLIPRLAVAVAAGAFLLGCADRPPAPSGAAPATTAFAVAAQQGAAAATGDPGRRWRPPAPVAMPGGGDRIDMRGSPWHVRTLRRQPDGSYKQACVEAPEITAAAGPR
jgi:hypothetical protein